MLPLRPRPLIGALLMASLVGIGPLFTLCLAVGSAFAVAHGAAAVVCAVVAAPLTLLVCVALARAVATANTRLLTSRKGRDLAVLSGLVIAVGIQVVNFGAQRLGRSGGLSALDPAADVVRWLPCGLGDRCGGLRGAGLVRPGRAATAALRRGIGHTAVAVAAKPGEADDRPGRFDARRRRTDPQEVRGGRLPGSPRCCPRDARGR